MRLISPVCRTGLGRTGSSSERRRGAIDLQTSKARFPVASSVSRPSEHVAGSRLGHGDSTPPPQRPRQASYSSPTIRYLVSQTRGPLQDAAARAGAVLPTKALHAMPFRPHQSPPQGGASSPAPEPESIGQPARFRRRRHAVQSESVFRIPPTPSLRRSRNG